MSRGHGRSKALALVLLALSAAAAQGDDPAPKPDTFAPEAIEFFETNVRPLLAERCLQCHGQKKQSSGLRLDSRTSALAGGDSGPAVVPGEPDKSTLIHAVRHDGDIRMPPRGKLEEPAIQTLTKWVAMGAPWPADSLSAAAPQPDAAKTHWAFQPVRQPPLPAANKSAWSVNPVDAFVLQKLEAAGLAPSPAADRRSLIRRATFDLTGLPPTQAEIEEFVADTSPAAFAKVIDRLLASPRYGERWGRLWLDVARYADTKGYVFTEERRYPFSFTYRDWVIRSFNEDLPYDQFVLYQLAADRLVQPDDTRPLAALGFLTVGRRFLNDTNDIIDDRIDVTTRGLLGLTVTCARCHDHKYDPIPSEDYYSLYGVYNSSTEPAVLPEITPSGSPAARADYERQRDERKQAVAAFLEQKRAESQNELRAKLTECWAAALELGFDPRKPNADAVARAAGISRRRLGWFTRRLNERLEKARGEHDSVFAPWHALASVPAEAFAEKSAEVIDGLAAAAAADPSKPVDKLVLKALGESPPESMKVVAVRYAELFKKAQVESAPEWAAIRERLEAPDGPFMVSVDTIRQTLDQGETNQFNELTGKLTALDAEHPAATPRAMALVDLPQPREPHVFLRGNPGRPGPQVPRRFLKVISAPDRQPFREGSGRLELARAIASPQNPLTARVFVNRVWTHHFGNGLVRTPSDFGARSDPPSHPELLDDLASRFVASGWSIKALHRLVMLSNTYQQASDNRADGIAADPMNLLLWKQNRRRLDFEAMRDSILAVAGTLDGAMGGKPVPLAASPFPTRRTVYAFIDRQNLDGVFRTFDFASPDASSPRRYATIVPQQALFLMNNPFVAEQARRIATAPELAAAPDDRARIALLYGRIFGRPAAPRELSAGLAFLEKFAKDSAGQPATLQPLDAYAQVLFLTNEFMYID